MVARFTGASLGLFAFAVTTAAGLFVHNPVEVVLSRGILALFVFCFLGFLLGHAAQLVVAEYEKDRATEISQRFRQDPDLEEARESIGEGEPEVSASDGQAA